MKLDPTYLLLIPFTPLFFLAYGARSLLWIKETAQGISTRIKDIKVATGVVIGAAIVLLFLLPTSLITAPLTFMANYPLLALTGLMALAGWQAKQRLDKIISDKGSASTNHTLDLCSALYGECKAIIAGVQNEHEEVSLNDSDEDNGVSRHEKVH
jgi:hypothetical protein